MRFVDTNVLLYSISTSEDEADKAQLAAELLESRDLVLSTQVLQEFYVQSTRSSRPDAVDVVKAANLVEAFSRFPVQEITLPIVRAAMDTHQRHRIAYWDAAIIEAARTSGCRQVLSEDLNSGQDFDGVTVIDPFM